MSDSLLHLDDIHVHYGSIHALHGVSLDIYEKEIVTILGSNGAGKSTTLHTISGLLKLSSGNIAFDGVNISKTKPHRIVSLGISQSPEGRMIFPNLSVLENIDIGAYRRKNNNAIKQTRDMVFDLFPRLKERSKQAAGTLSGGEQQMLAIGRALMSTPKLLLLDEPSLGIAPILTKTIFNAIVEINKEGTTILLVEQNANAALKIATRGYVLTNGKISLQGDAKDLLNNEKIQQEYLGKRS